MKIKYYISAFALLLVAAIAGVARFGNTKPLDPTVFDALYNTPAPPPVDPQNIFFLGHSLVGTGIPEILMELAGEGHNYSSQLGWGTSMQAHWDHPNEPINGFQLLNAPSDFTDAKSAISSGSYNTMVLTEMVEIRDAIKYFDSGRYLHEWVSFGRQAYPEMRFYFYETWHPLDDREGWLERIDRDLERYWEKEIIQRALAFDDQPKPIYVIPAGQVMARFVRKVEERGGIGPISDRKDLFFDNIHLNAFGAYLVALTHYAVLYQKSPVGLPHVLKLSDGTPVDNPGPEAARLMQEIVWDVVTSYSRTGVPRQ